MKYSLRDYQAKINDDVRGAIGNGARAPLVVAPTGSGKTVNFASVTEGAARRGNRVLIMLPKREIVAQTEEKIRDFGISYGIIQAGRAMDINEMVQIASVQTLVQRIDRIIPPDIIIIDEGHHIVAGSWEKIVQAFPDAYRIGFTATPARLDGKGLGRYYDALVKGPSVKELIQRGFLSPFVVYAPPQPEQTTFHTRFGDFVKSEVAAAMDKSVITGDCIQHYLEICPGLPAMAFCASVEHAEHVAEGFRQAGVPAASIDGTMSDQDRKSRIKGLADGVYSVLTSCDLVSEGVDIPVCSVAILLRPTQSLALYLQQVGRVLRPFPGKKYAIILDHVGNVRRHLPPDEEREWSLDGGVTRRTGDAEYDRRYWQCEFCYANNKHPDIMCWNCHREREFNDRTPDQVDGTLELQPTTEQMYEEYRALREREALRKRVWWVETYEEVAEIGKKLGYNPKWAGVIWNQRKKRKQRRAV